MAMNSIETGPGLQCGQEILDEVILSSVFAYSQFFDICLQKKCENLTLHFNGTNGCVYKTIFHFPILISGLRRQQARVSYARADCAHWTFAVFFAVHLNAERFKADTVNLWF